ncbi:FAD/NAD(P)-binding protein [Rhizobium cremeum]|uniref:FAD/NAD(P)-binding protein n=1 Tax=Rhizobium cremeum TaxID=2813827 RepID=UPI000DE12B69|nr:FAD/NAD(P)-binding protein [Rhizobium cremeum]MCJ7994470.1 FAD/NAD(P)-binding protein [Rhizobium cremeum]MCJ7999969.1 FAD/NAD(P)-binding protein [Rhizobium cremeum]
MLKIRMSSVRSYPTAHRSSSRIAIIGGGYTGALIAKLLVERGPRDLEEVTVFEPRDRLGSGLAYDVEDADLRLNVAAHRMRAIPGAPAAFLDWLQTSGTLTVDPRAVTPEGVFARRRDFGRFMETQLSPLLERGAIRHVRENVRSVSRMEEQWRVTSAGGMSVAADVLILATGHPAVSRPPVLDTLDRRAAGGVIDAFAPNAFENIDPAEPILIVGSGLTALDAIVRLEALGHFGQVTLLSRSGLLPRPHAGAGFAPFGEFLDEKPTSTRQLLARVRATISQAQAQGIPWQSVFDALRQQSQSLWQNLPSAERQKFLRRLRRWYDVHRYRMPPQVSAALERGLASRRMDILAGHICSVRGDRHDLATTIRTRSGMTERHCNRILLATGRDFRDYCSHQRFLLAMHRDGFIQSDPLGLGLVCDDAGRAIATDGTPNTSLFVAGPPARPAFGELTGVPEIAAQAADLVDNLIRSLARETRTIVIKRLG